MKTTIEFQDRVSFEKAVAVLFSPNVRQISDGDVNVFYADMKAVFEDRYHAIRAHEALLKSQIPHNITPELSTMQRRGPLHVTAQAPFDSTCPKG
jgi:hypothetical protein